MAGLKWRTLFLVWALTAVLAPATEAETGVTIQRIASWHGVEPDARILHLARIGEREFQQRYFFVSEDGSAYTWGNDFKSSGTDESHLFDPVTGGWLRLRIDYPIQGQSLDDMFRRFHEEDVESRPITVTLRNSKGFDISTEFLIGESYELADVLFDWLTRQDATDELLRPFPPGVAQTIQFLATSQRDIHSATTTGPIEGSSAEPLMALLARHTSHREQPDEAERPPMILEFFGKDETLLSLPRGLVEQYFGSAFVDRPFRIPGPQRTLEAPDTDRSAGDPSN